MTEKIPQLRATIVRRRWLSQDCDPEAIADEVAEPGDAETREEMSRLCRDLLLKGEGIEPYHFEKFEKCTDLASCLKRIRCRVGELQRLMPLLEPEGERFAHCAGEMGEIKSSVLKDFQRMVSLLDRAGKGKLPADFSEWEEKLDAIDESLEAAFNRVGELSHGTEARGV